LSVRKLTKDCGPPLGRRKRESPWGKKNTYRGAPSDMQEILLRRR